MPNLWQNNSHCLATSYCSTVPVAAVAAVGGAAGAGAAAADLAENPSVK